MFENFSIFSLLCYNSDMPNFKQKLLIYFAALSAGTLLISNLSAVKLWNLLGIAVDGGVVLFPMSYILGDLIIEFYGKTLSKHIIFASFLVNILAILIFYIVIALPIYPGWALQESFKNILGFVPRIILGSLIAYIFSNLFNNYIFTQLKSSKGIFEKVFIARALGSSAFAHIIDSFIFEIIAYLGVLPFNEFLIQAGFAYILGLGLEIILSPIEVVIQKHLEGKILYESKLSEQ